MQKTKIYRFYSSIFCTYSNYLWGFIIISICWAAEMSIQPFMLKKMVEALSKQDPGSRDNYQIWAYGYIATTTLLAIILRLYHYLALYCYPAIRQQTISMMYGYLSTLHSLEEQQSKPGAFVKAMQTLSTHIEISCQIMIEMILPRALALIGCNITLCVLASPIYAGLLDLWTIIYLGITWQYLPTITEHTKKLSKQHQILFGWLNDNIDHHRVIHDYHNPSTEKQQLTTYLNHCTTQEQNLLKTKLKASIYQSINLTICISLLLYTRLCVLPTTGTQAGTLTLVIGITQAFMQSTHYLGTCIMNLTKSLSHCQQALHTLKWTERVESKQTPQAQNNQLIRVQQKDHHLQTMSSTSTYTDLSRSATKQNEAATYPPKMNLLAVQTDNNKARYHKQVHQQSQNHLIGLKQQEHHLRPQKLLNHAIRIKQLQYLSKKRAFQLHIPELTIMAKEKILLTGESGSGKSTLAKLLYQPWHTIKGKIIINNQQDLSHRRHGMISYIPQRPGLLNRSIIDNIRGGRKEISMHKIIDICKRCCCHDFIMQLKQQYDTVVGNCGTMLSPGQRQRIVLARCLIQPSPIIIFDEATAYVDTETIYQIFINLSDLLSDKTIINIAHNHQHYPGHNRQITLHQGRIINDIKKCQAIPRARTKSWSNTRSHNTE